MKIKELIKGKEIRHVRISCSSYLPDWRKGSDHLKSYSAHRSRGGGVLLDLSHEFDYISHLFGPFNIMYGKYGRVSDVTVDAEDCADLILSLANGVQVNLHLNFMSMAEERKIIVDHKDGYCIGDLIKYEVKWKDGLTEEDFHLERDKNVSYAAEIGYFFNNIGNPKIMNNIKEAAILLNKVLEFKNG